MPSFAITGSLVVLSSAATELVVVIPDRGRQERL
jgi:hypothetical protein